MATTKVKVKKEHVMAIMKEAGWGEVEGKSQEWFEDKIPNFKDVIAEDFVPADDEVNATLQAIYTGIDEGAEFEVEGDWPELPGKDNKEAKAKKGGGGKKGKTDEEKAAAKAEKEASKAAKKAEKEASKAAKKEAKKKEKGPGVISSIYTCLTEATEENPVTKEQVLEKLVEIFPDRDRDSMKNTINIQMGSRMEKEKNVTIHKVAKDDAATVYWATKNE